MSRKTIGVLAIQGAVREHTLCLEKINCNSREIRYPRDLEGLDGIILPGGESTAMAIVGEQCGLFEALKKWVKDGKPVWGTCAGMILLSDHAIKKAECGQALIGGLDCYICRNYFGSQINSTEISININASVFDAKLCDDYFKSTNQVPAGITKNSPTEVSTALYSFGASVYGLYNYNNGGNNNLRSNVSENTLTTIESENSNNIGSIVSNNNSDNKKMDQVPFSAVFIRAPAIIKAGRDVEILGSVIAAPHSGALDQVIQLLDTELNRNDISDSHSVSECWSSKRRRSNSGSVTKNEFSVAVAVRQGSILATAFHPELTSDLRWHKVFLNMVLEHK